MGAVEKCILVQYRFCCCTFFYHYIHFSFFEIPIGTCTYQERSLYVVFVVLRCIEAHFFIFGRYAKGGDEVYEFEDDERDCEAGAYCDQHGFELRHEDIRVAIEQAVVACAVDHLACKDASQQHTHNAT